MQGILDVFGMVNTTCMWYFITCSTLVDGRKTHEVVLLHGRICNYRAVDNIQFNVKKQKLGVERQKTSNESDP